MDQFKSTYASHEHSRTILDMLYIYDSFLDGIKVVADMGCGSGLDLNWWATLETRDEPKEPRNYLCYAIDQNIKQIDEEVLKNKNVIAIQGDFSERLIPRQVDLMWSHDSFQYALDPLKTLRNWNTMMNINGMLVLSLPQHQTYQYDRIQTRSYNGCYYHYNVCNLMYMLAVSGFDCRDCYIFMEQNNPWLHFAVYKNSEPFDIGTTTWHDLVDRQVVNDSVADSLNKFGHVRQEDLIFNWLDRDWRFAKN
jgi:SAM-dependent methyltransferase